MPDLTKLIAVFEDARRLVALPDNDFAWSGWNDHQDALNEIDEILGGLRSSNVPTAWMSLLFAPTGAIQELSLSSGWGDEFIELANRFDEALASDQVQTPSTLGGE